MIIPLIWTQKSTIPNLQKLLDNYHEHGGVIVQYERVVSLLVFSWRATKFEWVGPHTTRRAVGCKYALWNFLLGWWSVPGFFWTIGAIINNLMGGIDVTRVLALPPPLPGQPFDETAVREMKDAQKRQQYALLGVLFIILILIVVFVVIPGV